MKRIGGFWKATAGGKCIAREKRYEGPGAVGLLFFIAYQAEFLAHSRVLNIYYMNTSSTAHN